MLKAVETAAIVINAEADIESATQTMMEHAKEDELCRIIIINKIDSPDVDLETLVNEIQNTFGSECLPLNLPSASRDKVVDCFFKPEGEATLFSSVEEAHTTIIDQVVEVDEELMEIYLEQGQELDPKQLHDPFEKALRDGHLIPICFVSAKSGAGIGELLEVMAKLMPDPTEGNPPNFLKGEGSSAVAIDIGTDPAKHAVAHVFKVSNDPFRRKLCIFRIHQGTITPNTQLFIGEARKPFKVSTCCAFRAVNRVRWPAPSRVISARSPVWTKFSATPYCTTPMTKIISTCSRRATQCRYSVWL